MAMQRIQELDKAFHFKNNAHPFRHDESYGTLDAFLLEHRGTKASTVYTLRLNEGNDAPLYFERSLLILDDSYSVKPYYVAGYSQDKSELFLYPVSAGTTEYMGPRKTYFLTLTHKG
jgi:hypothetical protein